MSGTVKTEPASTDQSRKRARPADEAAAAYADASDRPRGSTVTQPMLDAPVLSGKQANTKAVDPKRVRVLHDAPLEGTGPVIYWMSRDQRATDNWALLYAQERAMQANAPLAVVFNLVPKYLEATIRQFGFMLRGLAVTDRLLQARNIPLVLLKGDPTETVPEFVKESGASLLVTDFSPLRTGRQWRSAVASAVTAPMHEVDAHNVVPVWMASDRLEYAARTIRRRITDKLSRYLVEFPTLQAHPVPWAGKPVPDIDWKAERKALEVDRSVRELAWAKPGEVAARTQLRDFVENRLHLYASSRNDPNSTALSNLSPWLHFGHIASQRCVLEANKHKKRASEAVDGFVEEIVVRKELSDNYCFYNLDGYDKLDGLFPQYGNASWSQKSLAEHAGDAREHVYTESQFEQAQTHESLWNAAQLEMVHTGKMHGFMRMYWAKKILEWSESPEEALRIALRLNDKYELDGRDPNGYVGCAWAIAGLHDQGWRERDVFGKVRYMNLQGCKRKFDVQAYVGRMQRMARAAAK